MLWRALLGLEHHLLSFVLGQAHVPSKGTPKSHPGGGSRLICCHLLPSLPSLHTALGCLFIPVSSCLRSPWGICSLLAVCVCLLSSQHVQWLNSVAVKNPTPALHSRELCRCRVVPAQHSQDVWFRDVLCTCHWIAMLTRNI